MATITKPMALDESFNTTESTSRNQADVLAGIEQAIVRGFGQVADAVSYDNTDSGLTADNVQDAIDEVDDTVDGLVDDVTEISSNIESTKTASGNPLTLTDAAPINAESLVVELEPKQDLHGQDAPYVGGAGKNKLNMSDKTFGGTDAYFSEWIYNSGIDNAVELQAGVTYTLSFDITCNNMPCYVSVGAGNGYYSFDIAQVEITENGRAHITFTPTNESLQYGNILAFRAPRYGSLATYSGTLKNIMLEVGSSPTTFAPYSNICPITGYTECEVETADSATDPTITNSATIQFGQTVYGAIINLLTGECKVNRGFVNPKDCTVAKNSSSATDYLYYLVASSLPESADLSNLDGWKSSHMGKNGVANPGNFAPSSQFGVVYMNLGNVIGTNTVDGFKQYCTNNNVQIAYPLAEPFTIQLTPQELKLLKGTNNITTNGTTINLGYQPDNVIGEVKGEIEKCAVDAEFMQFTDGTDTFTDVNLSLDASLHTVSVVGSKIEQKRFICFEVMDKMGGVLQGILASCIAFTDGAKTPSGTAFRAYIESLQMYVNFRIYGSGGSYTLAYQSETSFSASAFYVRVRMMNNL